MSTGLARCYTVVATHHNNDAIERALSNKYYNRAAIGEADACFIGFNLILSCIL